MDSFYICLVIPVWKRRLTKKIIKCYTPVYTASATFTITASQDGASQTEVSEVILGWTNMELLDETGIPAYPDNPRDSSRDGVKGAAAGCMLGLIWTGAVMLSRNTIRRKEDFQKRANMKCIGEIPPDRNEKEKPGSGHIINILNEKTDPRFEEVLQMVRSKVEYSVWRHHSKTILVTSALAGEAKLHDVLITGKTLGMDDEFRFYFLPGGKAVEDGSRLLEKERMRKIIEVLEKKVDIVILDSAPAGMLTDAGVLAQYADSALFVIKKDYAGTSHIMDGLEELAESRVHLIGGILNGV